MKFEEIELAFTFVSMERECTNSAFLCKETGMIYYTSEIGDPDDLPEDVNDTKKYIEIPHKNDLDLGRVLVMEFVSDHLPEDLGRVNGIFRRKGAYARFKALLEDRGRLEQWYDYEERKQEAALREWCSENGIEISG